LASYIGALNQVVHPWRYDSLADMERKRAARDADPAWGEFQSLTEGMILALKTRLCAQVRTRQPASSTT